MNLFVSQEMTESITAPPKADINPIISNPSTKEETNHKSKALITNVNKPSVKILIGKVISIKTGLINALIKPNMIALTIAM